MEPRIMILDGNQRAALAAVRAMGAEGLWVSVGECTPSSLAGASRFCQRSFRYSDPCQSPRLFFEDILRYIEQFKVSFLLPISESSTYVLLKYRQELPDTVTLPFSDTESVEQLADKNSLFRLAQEINVPIPETTFCENRSDGFKALAAIEKFPIVLKPSKSKVLQSDGILSTSVIIAKSREEARKALVSKDFFDFPFTVQSFVEGTGQGIFALFDHGKPVCYFSHRRLREKPPGGGVSVLCESTPINHTLKNHAEALLKRAQWHGVAMIEFKVSESGTGYLMEVNPRFWGSLQLAIDSGINFPWWLYLLSVGQSIPKPESRYRRVRWLLGDLDRLYLVLKSPSATYTATEKLIEVFRFLKPSLRTRHEVNRWHDPSPFWYELKQYLRALKS